MDFNLWYNKIYNDPYIFTSKDFLDTHIHFEKIEYNVNKNNYAFYIPPSMNFQSCPCDAFLYKDKNGTSNLVNTDSLIAPVYNLNFSNDISQYRLEGCNVNILSDYIPEANTNLINNNNNSDGFSQNIDGYRITVEKHKVNNILNTKPWQTRSGQRGDEIDENGFAIHKEIGYKHNNYIELFTGQGWKNGNFNITNNKMTINKGESLALAFTPVSNSKCMEKDFASELKIKNIQIELCLKAL